MVPVVDMLQSPLMPCTERRARKLIEAKVATPFYKKGIFCIRLNRAPAERKFQKIVVGVDPGSRFEAFVVLTRKSAVISITSNVINICVKLRNRRLARRFRRYRKSPYRKQRCFRRRNNPLSPVTRARWGAKLRILHLLKSIIPITNIVLERVKAKTRKGQRKWNKNFAPLAIGVKYFAKRVLSLGLKILYSNGYITSRTRMKRGLKKTRSRNPTWWSHCIDAHCLAERKLGAIPIFTGMYRIDFNNFHRRQLFFRNPLPGGTFQAYGSTRTLGQRRGCVVKHVRYGFCYLGGTSNDRVTYLSATNKRLTQIGRLDKCKVLTNMPWRISYCGVAK